MNPEPLVEAAGLVADGAILDWGSVTSGLSTDEDRAIADELAMIARVAQGHRQLHELLPLDRSGKVALDRTAWGHLELLEVLGRGSYGTVYRAWDPRLDRQVALKLFHGPRDPEVVMNEGRMLAKIRHDNVVAVYGADVVDGIAGIWMEFIRGRNLEQIVKDHGPMSASEATLIGLDMARALAAVHGAGLLHCDVKAQNVVREPGGRLVLMDLGASRSVPGADDTTTIGQVSGTPRYMAPELFDRAPASPQSDIYSLGVLLFFLVTGKFPVEGGTLSEIRQAQKQGRRTHLRDVRPELPAGYLREVTRALERSPLARHHSAGELEAGLLSQSTVIAPASAPTATARKSRSVMAPILAVLAVVAGAALVTWYWRVPAVSTTATQSIAVLPIRNLTGDPAKDYLADGLTDVLISKLARVRSLRVPSRGAVATYRDDSVPADRIARNLGVNLLLAGSMFEAGGQVRLAIQLIDPSGTIRWAEDITSDSSKVLAAQGQIAQMLAAHLSLQLSPEERQGISQVPANPQAQDSYLRGLVAAVSGEEARIPLAAQMFRESTTADPSFAPAWGELATIELRLAEFADPLNRTDRVSRAKELARHALELDATSPAALLAIGIAEFYYDWDFDAAEATLRRALRATPGNAEVLKQLGLLLAARGQTDEAVAYGETAVQIEPAVPLNLTTLAMLYYYQRNYERASEMVEAALRVAPDHAIAHFVMGRILSATGKHGEAAEHIDHALSQSRNMAWLPELACVLAAAGQTTRVQTVLKELSDRERRGESYSMDHRAHLAAAEGRLDDGIEVLRQAVDRRVLNAVWMAVDPRLDAYRGDPRFQQLLRTAKLQQ